MAGAAAPCCVWRLRVGDDGGAKPTEVVEALPGGAPPEGARYARAALCARGSARSVSGHGLATPGAVVAGHEDGAGSGRADGVPGQLAARN